MKVYKIEDIEQAFKEVTKENFLIEEKKVHTNPNIYKFYTDRGVFLYGKKMHQEIYRKLIEQLKTLQIPINCDELKFLYAKF